MITVPSLRRSRCGELASTQVIHDALTHPLHRFGHQTPLDRSQRDKQRDISSETK